MWRNTSSLGLHHFRLKPPCLDHFKLFVTDKTEVLTIQTCELEAPFSTGNENANHLEYELYDLYCSSHLLSTFAKLRKATVSFIMSVRSSVCPHATTLLPLDGFS